MSLPGASPPYSGLVEALVIPAEVHSRPDGTLYASHGSILPIHCCPPEEVAKRAATTHHYCGLFSDELLAPLGELAYVRLDDQYAEKVFINRSKRILVVSADGCLAQWRAAPTFESNNRFIPGAPIVNKDGAVVSVVTARRKNHYAVSTFEGEGGYFDTPNPWTLVDPEPTHSIYGAHSFPSRESLRAHVGSLTAGGPGPHTAVLHRGARPRIVLVASNGRQMAHIYLQGVHTTNVEYL